MRLSPHHHGISQDYQCQPKVDLDQGVSFLAWTKCYLETTGRIVFKLGVPTYYVLLIDFLQCNNFSCPKFF